MLSEWLKRARLCWGSPSQGWVETLSDSFVLSLGLSECLYVLLVQHEASFRTFWVLSLLLILSVLGVQLSKLAAPFRLDLHSPYPRMLILVAVVAVLATSFIDRPDADDETYLRIMASSLDGIDQPISGAFAGFSAYQWSCELVLIPGAGFFSGLPLLFIYYLAVPAVLALVCILFHARLIVALRMDFPLLALGFLILILLAWGDTHRTLSNTGLARFFHGKSAIPWVVMPALWTYWLSFRKTGNFRPLFLLLLCVPLGLALSPSGFFVSSLGLGMLILGESGRWVLSPHYGRWMRWALGSVLVALILWGLAHLGYLGKASPGEGFLGWQWMPEPPGRTDFEGLRYNALLLPQVLGEGFRGRLVYVSLALFPLLLFRHRAGIRLIPYAVVSLLLIINPLTPEMMATGLYSTMGWRWYWVLPIVPSLLFLNDRLAGIFSHAQWRWMPSLLLLGSYAFCNSQWIASSDNHARIVGPRYRLPKPETERIQAFPDRPDSLIELRGRRLVSPKGNLY